jgi:predicted RNA-binding protein with PIN domain
LIDGDNLLGTWPGHRRSDPGRRWLARELDRFAARERRRVVVVFDGGAPPGVAPRPDVHFAGGARTADDVILALLRREEDPRGWTVVTSDRSLGDQCRHMRARVERSDRFRRRLTVHHGPEKPEREEEIDYWLEQFGNEE